MYNKVRAKSIMDKFLLKVSNKDTERKSLTLGQHPIIINVKALILICKCSHSDFKSYHTFTSNFVFKVDFYFKAD